MGGGLRRLIKAGSRLVGYRIERTRPKRGVDITNFSNAPALTDVDVRFHVGKWRYLAPTTLMVGRPCFGYGPDAWHPYVATARQLLENPSLSYEHSVLRKVYEAWHPPSVSEAQFPGVEAPHPILTRIPAHTLFEPWQLMPEPCDDPLNPECSPSGAPLFGPVGDREGHREFDRLKATIKSISTYGYSPDLFPRGLITGTVLKHEDETRFLVVHGQHRTAVLSAMGVSEIEVGVRGSGPRVVETAEAEKWPHVASGLIPVNVAVAQAARYFDKDGGERAWGMFRRMVDSTA